MGDKFTRIRIRQNKVRRAIEHVEEPIGTVEKERWHAFTLMNLRRDMIAANAGLRKWYVNRYGFAIDELTGFMQRYVGRLQTAAEGRDYDAYWARWEEGHKAEDAATKYLKALRALGKRRKSRP